VGAAPDGGVSQVAPVIASSFAAFQRPIARAQAESGVNSALGARLMSWVADSASIAVDPDADPPVHSRDPNDDDLISLASAHSAALVSGDKDLLALEGEIPVFSARAFLDLLAGA
jgi:predicted nucleic acid-binding protein